MDATVINIAIDRDLNEKAQSIFGAIGLDMSTAINMLLRNAISPQNASSIGETKSRGRHGAFGCLKGKINVPDDFNELL